MKCHLYMACRFDEWTEDFTFEDIIHNEINSWTLQLYETNKKAWTIGYRTTKGLEYFNTTSLGSSKFACNDEAPDSMLDSNMREIHISEWQNK